MLNKNITIGGLEQARAVAKPEITEIICLDDGVCLIANDYITSFQYQALIVERNGIVARMNSGTPQYACSICTTPVYLVATTQKHFFFRHRVEDGSCPAITRSALTEEEICARKYHGLRESIPHQRIKALIDRSLSADPAYSDIWLEKTWRSSRHAKAYRRPDVQADSAAGKLAFEVQLSTTFLSVVVGRRMFYRDEGALLVWVFGGFDDEYRRLTTDDLLFTNNSNVFVVDEQTAAKSEATKQFHLRCFYRKPVIQNGGITEVWKEKVAPFAALTQDRDGQRVFLFDYAGAEEALRQELTEQAEERHRATEDAIRDSFYDFWAAKGPYAEHSPTVLASWQKLREAFSVRGIVLPEFPDNDGETRAMLNGLYSVKFGLPVGLNFNHLIQVAHTLADNYPRQMLAFGYAVSAYGQSATLSKQDKTGKWKERMKPQGQAMRAYDPTFQPDRSLLPLMAYLFPEVEAKVSAYLARAEIAQQSKIQPALA